MSALMQWHEQAGLLRFSESLPGKVFVWTISVPLILWLGGNLVVAAALAFVLLLPRWRRILLSIAAVGVILDGLLRRHDMALDWTLLVHGPTASLAWGQIAVQGLAVLGMLYLAFQFTRQFNRWPAVVRRRPILALHCGIWLALCLSVLPPLAVLIQVSFLAWRLSYMVKYAARGLIKDSRFSDHLFYLMPVYGGTSAPFGKGLDFLSRHEAMDADAAARSQWAGIKLLLLAVLWTGLRQVLDIVAFNEIPPANLGWVSSYSLELARLGPAIAGEIQQWNWYQAWVIVALELIRDVLTIAITGHLIVGCLRLFGFNVFRNTYKPLLSESIVDYWGRYYYYFKELLVDFFFYPAYLRFSSVSNRLRLFIAVFAAAFMGNMYYHVLYTPEPVVNGQFLEVWNTWGTRLIYCALLALGIWISMLRQQSRRAVVKEKNSWEKWRSRAGVWLFFGLIQLWNQKSADSDAVDGFRFLFRMLGF